MRFFVRSKTCLLRVVIVCVGMAGASSAQTEEVGGVLYVKADAAGAGDGTNWADAYPSLQDALAVAETGDQIWVADGTYTPAGGRAATFQLKSGVRLYGGFAGTETARSQRDLAIHKTILSGDRNGDDVALSKPADLAGEPTRAENCYHVVTASGIDETAVLDGFVITGGNADGSGTEVFNVAGGGMLNDASTPDIRNCVFTGNRAVRGAGMANVASSPTVAHCLFSRNHADLGGGGMGNLNSRPTVINCTFSENSVDNETGHGGMGSNGGGPIVTQCIFWSNDSLQVASVSAVTYSCVQGGFAGTGNIDADPLFADPENGDYRLRSQAGRWDPLNESWDAGDVTSPCIDTGDPGHPIGRESFPNGGVINMGAYGGTAVASRSYFGAPPCESILAGDINGDCKVDLADFEILALHWTGDPSLLP